MAGSRSRGGFSLCVPGGNGFAIIDDENSAGSTVKGRIVAGFGWEDHFQTGSIQVFVPVNKLLNALAGDKRQWRTSMREAQFHLAFTVRAFHQFCIVHKVGDGCSQPGFLLITE